IAKRRKIRKGTKSCWECKRRKIRCTFIASTESRCDGCRSRGTKCIGQEFHNEPKAAKSKADRLDRMEALVEQLAKRADPDLPGLLSHNAQDARTNTVERVNGDPCVSLISNSPIAATQPNSGVNIQGKHRYDGIRGALLAVWPSQCELDLITSITVGTSVLFHGTVCMPYSRLLSKDMPSPQEMLQLPPPGSHPVLIARKLLMLASFLQGIPPGGIKELGILGIKCHEVMSSIVETVSRLITSHDNLVGSLEGIECVMIESMYHNNAGNLHDAWLKNRRAMVRAQMMGLHLGNSPRPNMLDVETRERIDLEHMWFRLVISDRYLSLMLGLPQGSQESPFGTPKALEGCAPMERMERIEAVVGGLILQRNKGDSHNIEATHEIDKLLQDAAASMPAQWWLTPDIASITNSDTNALSETIRVMNQFSHYHLLVQLYLPYIPQSTADRKYDYGKITAVNASREILSRFMYFRGSDMITAYCRGIDFLALIASTTLCLAHIDARRRDGIGMGNRATVFQFLAHQRLGDRGLMERMLQSMEKMIQVYGDTIACKIAGILRPLLAIEAAAANGGSYSASVSSELGEQEFSCGGNANDGGDPLRISIPYFGTIKIEHGNDFFNFDDNPLGADRLLAPELAADVDDWALQGMDMASFNSLIRG
ncbi:hypothetical protein NA57DRAFT_14363, partial [Rhizodiscina lignyota]